MFPFDPPENIRKPKVFLCFQGDQKETLGRKGLSENLCGKIYLKLAIRGLARGKCKMQFTLR